MQNFVVYFSHVAVNMRCFSSCNGILRNCIPIDIHHAHADPVDAAP